MAHDASAEGDERLAENRRELADFLAERVPFGVQEGDPTSGILTQWVVLAEFQADDGDRWLSLCSGNGSGSNDLPRWTLRALGHELRSWMDSSPPSSEDE